MRIKHFLIGLIATVSAYAGDLQLGMQYFSQGLESFGEGEYEEALPVFNQAIAEFKDGGLFEKSSLFYVYYIKIAILDNLGLDEAVSETFDDLEAIVNQIAPPKPVSAIELGAPELQKYYVFAGKLLCASAFEAPTKEVEQRLLSLGNRIIDLQELIATKDEWINED